MNADDIIDLIDLMAAAWPWAEWTGKQADLWCGALAGVERRDASVAVEKAITTLDKPPSIAWVLGEARSEAERRNVTPPALPAPPVDVDYRAKVVRELREMLEHPKPHDHRQGWEKCPTCHDCRTKHGVNPHPSKQFLAATTPRGNPS